MDLVLPPPPAPPVTEDGYWWNITQFKNSAAAPWRNTPPDWYIYINPSSGFNPPTGVISVPSDYPTPQAAINAAGASTTTILVGPGTYAGGIDFKGKSLTLQSTSGGTSTVILPPADGSSVVKAVTGEGPMSVIDGFTIQQGVTGTPLPGSPEFLVGGGIFIHYASPTFRNCIVRMNSAPYGGGAYLLQSFAVFENCQFYDNVASSDGGNAHCYGGGTQFLNCSFADGVAQVRGGGLHLVGGNPSLINCDVTRNDAWQGGGMSWYPLTGTDDLFFSGGDVQQNTAVDAGGGIWMDSGSFFTLKVRSSTVCNNSASVGPANIYGQWVVIDGSVVCDPPLPVCPADLNGDGTVNGADLSYLLSNWGGSGAADINNDGVINGADFSYLLSAWGQCPA